ncbi:ABC transporter ATP-binding protein [Virgibacillus halophilus]|uniref:ABC transporter ATP-binding protein n=1 Tax=Tigheibacillus halophilus TaxID=361280 RepID=A0ABU5C2Q4_9BACI|nr:ABC transporter ATP-binding protein [Virgibacillus halophilus]
MEIKDVSFSYDRKNDQIKHISTTIQAGKITTIIGPNGSGKSTLLSLLAKNERVGAGQILLHCKNIMQYSYKRYAQHVAVVHQYNQGPGDLTVEKLVAYGRLPYRTVLKNQQIKDEKKIIWALACTNLTEKRNLPISTLSGGEKQRAWIAMALAQDTPYLFLDEPTTFLDLYYQYDILNLLAKLNKTFGLTIVMVLHDINQAIQYSDYLMVMQKGVVAYEGTPASVITSSMLEEVYHIQATIKQDTAHGLYMLPTGTLSNGRHEVQQHEKV